MCAAALLSNLAVDGGSREVESVGDTSDYFVGALPELDFSIDVGDITTVQADVVALKYAHAFYGADEKVADLLRSKGVSDQELRPKEGESSYLDSSGAIVADHVLFVGVPPLRQLAYAEIRAFGATVIRSLDREAGTLKHLAMTIHGPGFGLDEIESFFALFAGLIEGLADATSLRLERVSIVEMKQDRVKRLGEALRQNLLQTNYPVQVEMVGSRCEFHLKGSARDDREAVSFDTTAQELPGSRSEVKPLVFVAMPFAEDMEDVFYYGIQEPVRAAGYLCERVDQSKFTGDVLQYVKDKIHGAAIVIADLTRANPNVFLEVGFAWGVDRPTILLAKEEVEKKKKKAELPFDVRGQRYLKYRTIKQLEQALTSELAGLNAQVSP
jgi:hypothetical protein